MKKQSKNEILNQTINLEKGNLKEQDRQYENILSYHVATSKRINDVVTTFALSDGLTNNDIISLMADHNKRNIGLYETYVAAGIRDLVYEISCIIIHNIIDDRDFSYIGGSRTIENIPFPMYIVTTAASLFPIESIIMCSDREMTREFMKNLNSDTGKLEDIMSIPYENSQASIYHILYDLSIHLSANVLEYYKNKFIEACLYAVSPEDVASIFNAQLSDHIARYTLNTITDIHRSIRDLIMQTSQDTMNLILRLPDDNDK